MPAKKHSAKTVKPKKNKAAVELAQRSIEARKEKWGVKEFNRRMKEYGKLGGRPKKKRKGGKDA